MTYTVFRYGDERRPYYVVRWRGGPPGAERGERSTKQKTKRKAEAWAANFVATLGQQPAGEVSWAAFRQAFNDERLPELASAASYRSALNAVETLLAPKRLADIDAAAFDILQRKLRAQGKRRATAASYSKMLRAAMGWAEAKGMLERAPKVKTGQTNDMRGRPLTHEEFERLLAVTPKVVGARNAIAWRRVLWGAYSIGLRRAEFLRVWWDRDDRIHVWGLESGTPMIEFPADQHKARRDMRLPLLAEAAEMLRQTPKRDRQGPVFLPLRGSRREIRTAEGIGRTVKAIAVRASLITKTDPDTDQKHYATIHDLRKSLGDRLAQHPGLTVPQVMKMMRHTKIETTLDHYAALDAARIAESLPKSSCTLSCTADQLAPSVATPQTSSQQPLASSRADRI